MLEPSNQKIKLKITGAEAVVKDWITAGESQAIAKLALASTNVSINAGAAREGKVGGDINAEAGLDYQNQLVAKYVISINNETENIIDVLLALPEADYQQLVDHVYSLDKKKS